MHELYCFEYNGLPDVAVIAGVVVVCAVMPGVVVATVVVCVCVVGFCVFVVCCWVTGCGAVVDGDVGAVVDIGGGGVV